jgi:hypothetical protein
MTPTAWFLLQLGFLSLAFAALGWFASADRPVFARVVISIMLAAAWPVLLPIGIWMSVREYKAERDQA